jgi:hypothetical protein
LRTYPNVERLQDGGTYQVRTTRLRGDTAPSTPFAAERIFVMRDPKGRVCLVTTKDRDWAESDPRNGEYWEEGGVGKFQAEDYLLEIELSSITDA